MLASQEGVKFSYKMFVGAFLPREYGGDKEDRPTQSLEKAGPWRVYILDPERNDDPNSSKREGESYCNVLEYVGMRPFNDWRVYLNHVHAKDALNKDRISKKSE